AHRSGHPAVSWRPPAQFRQAHRIQLFPARFFGGVAGNGRRPRGHDIRRRIRRLSLDAVERERHSGNVRHGDDQRTLPHRRDRAVALVDQFRRELGTARSVSTLDAQGQGRNALTAFRAWTRAAAARPTEQLVGVAFVALSLCALMALHAPGHMSYDSLVQLDEGFTRKYYSWNPPGFSLFLGQSYALFGGTAGALLISQALLLVATYRLAAAPSAPVALRLCAFVSVLAVPIVIIYAGILWKDVFFAHLALMGFAVLQRAPAGGSICSALRCYWARRQRCDRKGWFCWFRFSATRCGLREAGPEVVPRVGSSLSLH